MNVQMKGEIKHLGVILTWKEIDKGVNKNSEGQRRTNNGTEESKEETERCWLRWAVFTCLFVCSEANRIVQSSLGPSHSNA